MSYSTSIKAQQSKVGGLYEKGLNRTVLIVSLFFSVALHCFADDVAADVEEITSAAGLRESADNRFKDKLTSFREPGDAPLELHTGIVTTSADPM